VDEVSVLLGYEAASQAIGPLTFWDNVVVSSSNPWKWKKLHCLKLMGTKQPMMQCYIP
jgi:hypothetical protein